jgi:hypothetical protein
MFDILNMNILFVVSGDKDLSIWLIVSEKQLSFFPIFLLFISLISAVIIYQ